MKQKFKGNVLSPGIRFLAVEPELGGRGPLISRMRAINSSRVGIRSMTKSATAAMRILISSPAFSFSASTTVADRSPDYLPHFKTRMEIRQRSDSISRKPQNKYKKQGGGASTKPAPKTACRHPGRMIDAQCKLPALHSFRWL
jgi:hypothetical protein